MGPQGGAPTVGEQGGLAENSFHTPWGVDARRAREDGEGAGGEAVGCVEECEVDD